MLSYFVIWTKYLLFYEHRNEYMTLIYWEGMYLHVGKRQRDIYSAFDASTQFQLLCPSPIISYCCDKKKGYRTYCVKCVVNFKEGIWKFIAEMDWQEFWSYKTVGLI